jgi:hypothetical protein
MGRPIIYFELYLRIYREIIMMSCIVTVPVRSGFVYVKEKEYKSPKHFQRSQSAKREA